MAINYDQREIKTLQQIFNENPDAAYTWAKQTKPTYSPDDNKPEGWYYDAYNNPINPFELGEYTRADGSQVAAYSRVNYDPNKNDWRGQFTTSDGSQVNGVSNVYNDQFTNKEIYDAIDQQRLSSFTDYLGIPAGDAKQLSNILFPYSSEVDYRSDEAESYYQPDSPGGRRLISDDPQKQAALDYLYQFQDAKRTSRRKSHQGATLAGILAFAGGAAGLAAGAGGTAAAGAGGTAAGTGGGTAVGGAGGAVAGGAPAASGGLFVGSGGFLGGTGSALADAALNSAIQSAITSGISGGNPLKGALTGGLTGGFGNAIGGFDFGLGEAGNSALAAALKGGLSSGISGGNPLIGAALGGASSGLNSVLNNGFEGFSFGGADGGASDLTFGGADGGPNGFQLPGGAFAEDSGNFDFTNSINNPFSGSGGNVGLFDGLFNEDANFDFTNSTSPNIFDQLTSGDNGGFSFTNFLGGDQPLDLGGAFDSNNPASFLDQGFPDATSSDASINSFLDQIFRQNGQTLDLSNSGGPDVQQALSQLAPGQLQQLLSQFGPRALNALLGGAGGGGALSGLTGGGGGGSGGGNNVPQFYTDGVQDLLSRGRAIADQPFQSYTDQGVAPIDPNQQRAAELAASSEGAFSGDIDRARTFNQDGSRAFTDADINAYINPYVRGALDPVADRLRESAAMERTRNNALSVQRGAFGGSRQAVTDSLTERGLEDNLRQLYGTGYANAYTNAQGQFNADRTAKQNAAGTSLNIANTGTNLVNNDVNRLGTTGTARRGALNDANSFGYKEFIRQQEYPAKQFGALTSAFGLQQPSALNNEPNKFVQGLGALTAGYGLYNSIFN